MVFFTKKESRDLVKQRSEEKGWLNVYNFTRGILDKGFLND